MKRFKKLFCFFLVSIFLLSIASNQIVFAKEEASSVLDKGENKLDIAELKSIIRDKTDIKIIAETPNSLEHLEYTYSQDEKNYKVIENSNKNLTYVKSDIFIQDSFGEYMLDSSTITDIRDDKIIITKTEDGQSTKNVIDLESVSRSSKPQNDSSSKKPSFVNTLLSNLSSEDVSAWTYHFTSEYSYRIYTYTLVAVTAVVTGIATYFSAGIVAGVAPIVSYIIDDHIERIWYKVDVYYKYILMQADYRYKVAEMAYEFHYDDSDHSKYLGMITNEYWLHPEYK